MTNDLGFFEIYQLPFGKYELEIELPIGLSVGMWKRDTENIFSNRKIEVNLKKNSHISVGLSIRFDNSISGKVFDPSGNPVEKVCVKATNTTVSKPWSQRVLNCTDSTNTHGTFAIEGLAPGSYRIAINPDGVPKANSPFPKLYYPGTEDEANADVVNVKMGDRIDGVEINIPSLKDVYTFSGKLVYRDGKPVRNTLVKFIRKGNNFVEYGEQTKTDADGLFELRLAKGTEGRFEAKKFFDLSDKSLCTPTRRYLQSIGETRIESVTSPFRLIADSEKRDIELMLPLASCFNAIE